MSKSKTKSRKSDGYLKTFREGAIAANVFRETSADGHTFLDFKLSRSWKSPSGNRQGYSDKFYAHNADAIANVSKQAAQWIQENPEQADADYQPPSQMAA